MRELVILGSSSIPANPLPNPSSPKPKPKPAPSLHRPTKPIPTVHSCAPLSPGPNSSFLLKHYTDPASRLLGLAESVLSSRIEPSLLAAGLSDGISQNIREGNLETVIDVLKRFHKLGLSPVMFFDGIATESLKKECLKLLHSGELNQFVALMETLSGIGFPVKELVEPSHIVKICVDKRDPVMAVRYVSVVPNERMLFCTIVNEFGRRRDLESALIAYEGAKDKLGVPNMYLYRTIIDVCGLCVDCMKSRDIYEDLLNQKITPNIYVFNSLMNVNAHDLTYALCVYKHMQNLGVTPDVASYNILLKACSLSGRVDLAQDIYREMKQLESGGLLKLDVFTYCTIIKVLADAKLWKLAIKVKDDMLSSGVTPNTHTWSSLISACANAGVVEQAIRLSEQMVLAGVEPNPHCCNILIHACVEACQYDRAFRFFQSWKESSVHDTCDKPHKSNRKQTSRHVVPHKVTNLHPLNFIQKVPFAPTLTTYNTLMKACGSDYIRAKAFMDEMKAVGLSPNHISWTILIDMCGSSGNVDGAMQILKDMREAGVEPDVIAYTTAIKVCVEAKNLKQAFSLFAEMKSCQIKPNLVTYNTLLKARTRYGSLKEVRQCLALYQDMRKAGYKPSDYYLKQLIEEWCEGVIQGNDKNQDEVAFFKRTDMGRPHSLLFEKVAAHLQTSNSESLAINLQGLTKVEARIVVLAVLRKIKESYTSGHSVKDDMWITFGANDVEDHSDKYGSQVKAAVLEVLKKELGLEVLIAAPRFKKSDGKIPLDSDVEYAERLGMNSTIVASPRRPPTLQRLRVTRKSLHQWLQRKAKNMQR